MKKWMLLIVFCTSVVAAFGEISEKEMKRLTRSVDVVAVRDRSEKDDDRNRYLVLSIDTNQDSRDLGFMMRILVEVIDKSKNTYLIEAKGKQQNGMDDEYTGEDQWELWMPYGEIDKPKVNASVVQYGIIDEDGTYYPLVEDYDGVKTMDEFTERTKEAAAFTGKIQLRHAYTYEDDTEGAMDTTPKSVRLLK